MTPFTFTECNANIGGGDYLPLPACVQTNGLVTFGFNLSPEEIKNAASLRSLGLTFATFGRPLQPFIVHIGKPTLPIHGERPFTCNPDKYENGAAFIRVGLNKAAIDALKEVKQIFITVSTYGAALNPISPLLK